ncbi:MAG TPA: Rrf2 family transcriptional regulator [Candidatus Omnitrophota bacterium]|nr:Rrf2 family transcriptional regulator [Candidatus Omnitrophota bacterium]HPT07879.1 Rrf2 family transcriptional regulator [Candidatus Omnitrophota bacterium]
MKLITRDTDYAIRAICFMARHKDQVISVNELVRELAVPKPFLRKILQVLNKKEIVYSHKGLGGGFSLARPVDTISIMNVMEIFQGEFNLNECHLKKNACPQQVHCPLRAKITSLETYVADTLEKLTIGELLKEAV